MNLKKKLIINLICILLIIGISEIFSCIILSKRYSQDIKEYTKITQNKEIKIPLIKYSKTELHSKELLYNGLRPIEYRDSNKQPIILFGCSFTYGFGLNENEIFSRKLADYTNRTVINRGRIGTGIPFLYYQLHDKELIEQLPKNPEYIIFTLIPDHFPRLFRYRNFVMTGDHTLRYKIKNDKLVEDKPIIPAIHSLFTSIIIEEYLAQKNGHNKSKIDSLFKKLMEDSYKLIKQNFPNTKFVVLYYENPLDKENLYEQELQILKDISNDIIVINIKEEIPNILESKYWIEDNSHPSSLAWDTIIPILDRKLKLN